MQVFRSAARPLLPFLLALFSAAPALAARIHIVTLGAVRKVPYTPPEATPDNKSEEATTLRIRPLLIDDKPREWSTLR